MVRGGAAVARAEWTDRPPVIYSPRMRGIRQAAAIVASGVCGLSLVPGAVAAGPARTEPVAKSPAVIKAYWTGARMRNAEPADTLSPTPLSGAGDRGAASGRAKSLGLHQRVGKTSSYPNRTDGIVFFSLGPPNAGDYSCSGTAVRSPSRSLVWTAGHCVYDPGVLGSGYATNWEFVPGYNDGRKPFGEWPASALATTPQWKGTSVLSGGDEAFDFGAATVAPRHAKRLQDRIGARRIAFNRPRNQVYTAFGYPAERPPPEFDGQHLFRCRSPYRGADTSIGPPAPMRISCDMTAGASGGGWVLWSDGRGFVNSVTSYGYSDDRTHFYGPYQGSAALRLYRAAGG
jgi:hypothetical protein